MHLVPECGYMFPFHAQVLLCGKYKKVSATISPIILWTQHTQALSPNCMEKKSVPQSQVWLSSWMPHFVPTGFKPMFWGYKRNLSMMIQEMLSLYLRAIFFLWKGWISKSVKALLLLRKFSSGGRDGIPKTFCNSQRQQVPYQDESFADAYGCVCNDWMESKTHECICHISAVALLRVIAMATLANL